MKVKDSLLSFNAIQDEIQKVQSNPLKTSFLYYLTDTENQQRQLALNKIIRLYYKKKMSRNRFTGKNFNGKYIKRSNYNGFYKIILQRQNRQKGERF